MSQSLHSIILFHFIGKNAIRAIIIELLMLIFSVSLLWAGESLLSRLAKEFYEPVISDFITFVKKGERYPLIHAITKLRTRVFRKKLGINKASETKVCSDYRNYRKPVPKDRIEFCSHYNEIIDFAREQIGMAKVFEPIYLKFEPELLREIEKKKARNAVRVWIHQKLNCLDDRFRCGRDERGMLERISRFEKDPIQTYRRMLQNLEKKLFPEEQVLPPTREKDLETKCKFIQKTKKYVHEQGMAYIKEGTFQMGSSGKYKNEQPLRQVNVRGFWIDLCEITNYQYLHFISKDPFLRKSTFPLKFHDGNYLYNWRDDLMPPMAEELKPVVYVSWYAARYFCNAHGKRLPSEAEWEKTAQDFSKNEYPFDGGLEFLQDHGWYRKNSGGIIHMTAEKIPNSMGIFDMLGNAWEWVYDLYSPYRLIDVDNPQGPKNGNYRVMRGGGWNDPPHYLRPAQRRDALPQSTYSNVGFRCAADFPEKH